MVKTPTLGFRNNEIDKWLATYLKFFLKRFKLFTVLDQVFVPLLKGLIG